MGATNPQLAEWIATARNIPHIKDVGYVAYAGAASANIRRLAPVGPESGANLGLMNASTDYLLLAGADTDGPSTMGLLSDPTLRNIALVGSEAAISLDLPPPGPGSTLWVNGRLVDVVGTIRAGERQPDLRNAVVVSSDVLHASPSADVSLILRTETGFPAAVAEAVPYALDAGNPGQFDIETDADLRNLRFGVASDLGQLVGVIAVGRLFIAEGAIIGIIIGGAVGVALGTALILVLASGQGWDPVLAPWLPPVGVVLGLATGLASSLVPAWAASRQEPALALRAR